MPVTGELANQNIKDRYYGYCTVLDSTGLYWVFKGFCSGFPSLFPHFPPLFPSLLCSFTLSFSTGFPLFSFLLVGFLWDVVSFGRVDWTATEFRVGFGVASKFWEGGKVGGRKGFSGV